MAKVSNTPATAALVSIIFVQGFRNFC